MKRRDFLRVAGGGVAVTALALQNRYAAGSEDLLPVFVRFDASKPMDELKPIWRFLEQTNPNAGQRKMSGNLRPWHDPKNRDALKIEFWPDRKAEGNEEE